jgi:hypothetical protein
MPAFPRFIGGPNLGSNLNGSMTAKAAIVGMLLAIIFPGIVVYLVQGSPSGSPLSGGTHVDDGDAGDFVYRYPDGRAVGLAVYLVASILWRMLDCLSYVRGFDVDKNGVKDDTFDQHNHVIDREGGGKALAVRNQISQFLAHLDGLVGGRADREKVVPATMTLAEYQTPAGQATFLFRFQQLTSEALGLPVHIAPEDDMTPDQANKLDNIYAALLIGGSSMKDGEKSVSQSLADLAAAVHASGLTVAQNNALMSTWQAVFSGGGDAGPQSMIARLAELQEQVAKVVAELQTGTNPTTTNVTVNLDDAAAARIATAVWAPIKNGI